MIRAPIKFVIVLTGSCAMLASSVAQAQAQEPSLTTRSVAPDILDAARLVRARIPWTWLLEDPEAGAAAVTDDQVVQADMIRRMAQVARHRGYDGDARYVRLRRALDDAALAEVARLSMKKAIPVTDADRRSYFVAHPGRYDQFRLRHIYIAMHAVRDGSRRSEAQALALAEEVEARLARGEDFEALARRYSDDTTTAAAGGELSVLTGAYLAKPFFAAVATASDGETTSPVKGDDGFHIIHVDQHIVGDTASAAYQIEQDILADRLPTLIRQAVATEASPAP